MKQLRSSDPRVPIRRAFVHKDLSSCTHVFIRHDAVKKALQMPYDGPYPVIERHGKYSVVDLNGRKDTVSLDCLKPAYVDSAIEPSYNPPPVNVSTPPASSQPPPPSSRPPLQTRTTRSGRRVHWPDRLYSYVS